MPLPTMVMVGLAGLPVAAAALVLRVPLGLGVEGNADCLALEVVGEEGGGWVGLPLVAVVAVAGAPLPLTAHS